jgi:hypothetical protein
MKRTTINLLPNRAKFNDRRRVATGVLKNVFYIGTGLCAGLWVIILSLIFGLKELTTIETGKETTLLAELSQMNDVVSSNKDLKYKIKQVGSVLLATDLKEEKKENISNKFSFVDSLLPGGLGIAYNKTDESGNSFTITSKTKQNAVMDEIEKIVEDMGSDQRLARATIQSISYDNGEWNFSLLVEVKQ